ncbi:MAG: hypothetical protein K0R43_3114 [Pseudoduganella sp.]|jgi:hypothetical protein|nr:hypothetical protein [Pseudoduganella sp.]
MKQTTKAALLSGLAFPGLGQLLILKRPLRGLACLLPSLCAFIYLMYGLSTASMTLMTEALNGTLAPDPVAIATRLHQTAAAAHTSTAIWIMLACWLISVTDALFLPDRR